MSFHSIEIVNAPSPTPTPSKTPVSSAQEVEQIIRKFALLYETDADRMVETARCESGLNPSAIGDGGSSVGLFQIHLRSHPQVSREEALDPYFAAEWSAQKFAENPRIWTCYRNLYE